MTMHYERYRIEAKITKPFPVAQFPLDSHLLTLAIENGELVREKMVFVPDLESTSVSSRVSIPGYRITEWQAIEKPHSYKTTRGDPRLPPGTMSTYSQFRLGISIERGEWGLYLKMFQALYVAVIIASLACFIKPTDVDPRFGLGVGALFAAVANSYLVSSFVPDTGELALADIVNGLGILTILVTLVESTVSLYLYDRCGEQELSRRLDRVSFIIVVVGFIAANLALVLAALSRECVGGQLFACRAASRRAATTRRASSSTITPIEDHAADDGELDVLIVGVHQVDRVAEHHHHGGADHHAGDASLAAAQRAAAEHGRGDGVQLVEVAEVAGLGRVDIEHEQHAAQAGQAGANHVGQQRHAVDVDAAVAGRFGLLPSASR